MDKYEVLLFFHLLGAFLIVGGAGVGTAAGIMMPRTTSVHAIALLSIAAHRAAMVVTLPGSVIVLGTGTWFVADYSFFDIDQLWLWLSYVLWPIAAGLDHLALGPFLVRIHRRAQALEAGGYSQSEDLRVAASAPTGPIVGMILIVITLVALYLMVFRPGS